MFTKWYSRLVILCFCVMLAGCATSRSEIKLQSPVIAAPAATSAQRVVVIEKITDERVFAEAPNDPSMPSLGFGGAGKATDDVKARAIGRKRNTYGMALGDVLLQPGQTVEGVVRENLIAAFQQAGYQVKSGGDGGLSPLVVDVHIKQFWAWFTPGFWAVTLSDNIATDLVINGIGAPVVVSTHVEDKRQVATEDAWMQIVDKGLAAYRAEVANRMQGNVGSNIAVTAANASPASPSVKPDPMPAPDESVAEAATAPSPVTSTPSQASDAAVSVPKPIESQPSSRPSTLPVAVASVPSPVVSTPPQESAASAAFEPVAQSVASQLGCGAVQANGAMTFIAPCGTYSVLIDCDGSQCRPMHTVNVKHDE
jgi:hypothetical protein